MVITRTTQTQQNVFPVRGTVKYTVSRTVVCYAAFERRMKLKKAFNEESTARPVRYPTSTPEAAPGSVGSGEQGEARPVISSREVDRSSNYLEYGRNSSLYRSPRLFSCKRQTQKYLSLPGGRSGGLPPALAPRMPASFEDA